MYTCPLAELRRSDEGAFGGKSANLGELLAAGIPVPPGFAIGADAFRAFLEETGLRGTIAAALARAAAGDVDAVAAASKAIGEAMRFAPFPDALRAEVEERYGELARSVGDEHRRSPSARARSARTAQRRATPGSRRAFSGCAGSSTSATQSATAGRACTRRTRSSYRAALGARGHGSGDGRHRPADGRCLGLGRALHVQPRERRPEHGRGERELGPRDRGRRRRGDAGRLPREQGHRRDRAPDRELQAGRVRSRRGGSWNGAAGGRGRATGRAMSRRGGARRARRGRRPGGTPLRGTSGRGVGDRARRRGAGGAARAPGTSRHDAPEADESALGLRDVPRHGHVRRPGGARERS